MSEPTSNAGLRPGAPSDDAPASSAGCVLRLYWMLGGNLALVLILAAAPGNAGGWDVGPWDGVYGAVVLSLVAARALDLARYGGTRADGSPAAQGDGLRYALVWPAVMLGAWIAARLLAR